LINDQVYTVETPLPLPDTGQSIIFIIPKWNTSF
jgi:hypothetical protein